MSLPEEGARRPGLNCRDCGAPLEFKEHKIYGWAWRCTAPGCDGMVSAHQRTGEPMGTPATKEVRKLRSRCHRLFDKWMHLRGCDATYKAYAELGSKLGLKKDRMHFGLFDANQCDVALKLLQGEVEKLQEAQK